LAPPHGTFGLLSLLDVDTGPIPLDDVARQVAYRHLAMEKPMVFSISPPYARFSFEGFSSRQGRTPLADDVLHVSRMNRIRPEPAAYVFQRKDPDNPATAG
jgi:hypothetical protein